MRVLVRYMILIIILGVIIQCNDFRKTPEQCREELKNFMQLMIITEPLARKNIKEEHPELTEEEIDREIQRGFVKSILWWAFLIDCIDEPLLDCRKIENIISRPDACI